MKRLKPAAVNGLLFVGTVLVCLAALEVALRLILYNFKPYTVSPGPSSTYPIERAEFKTMITTNQLNMRDHELGPRQESEYRILCLGDSFTFGLGVDFEETYPQQIERILRQEDPGYRVLNGSTGGNAVDALKFLEEKGLALEPYLVLLQVYTGNDFYDGTRYLPQGFSAKPRTVEPTGLLIKTKETIRGFRLCLVDFLWNCLIQVPWIDDVLFQKEMRYGNRGIYLRTYPELEEKLVTIELDAIEQIQQLCAKNDIRLLVMIIPAREQVFKRRFLTNEKYDHKKPNRILQDFCRKNDIEFVDFLDVYDEHHPTQVKPLYYIQDEHWTARGQAFAAQTLSGFVTRRKLRMPMTP